MTDADTAEPTADHTTDEPPFGARGAVLRARLDEAWARIVR